MIAFRHHHLQSADIANVNFVSVCDELLQSALKIITSMITLADKMLLGT